MSQIFNLDKFREDLQRNINECVDKIMDEVIEEARNRVTKEIRAKTGSIASSVLTFFEIHLDKNRLVITVDVRDLEK